MKLDIYFHKIIAQLQLLNSLGWFQFKCITNRTQLNSALRSIKWPSKQWFWNVGKEPHTATLKIIAFKTNTCISIWNEIHPMFNVAIANAVCCLYIYMHTINIRSAYIEEKSRITNSWRSFFNLLHSHGSKWRERDRRKSRFRNSKHRIECNFIHRNISHLPLFVWPTTTIATATPTETTISASLTEHDLFFKSSILNLFRLRPQNERTNATKRKENNIHTNTHDQKQTTRVNVLMRDRKR